MRYIQRNARFRGPMESEKDLAESREIAWEIERFYKAVELADSVFEARLLPQCPRMIHEIEVTLNAFINEVIARGAL